MSSLRQYQADHAHLVHHMPLLLQKCWAAYHRDAVSGHLQAHVLEQKLHNVELLEMAMRTILAVHHFVPAHLFEAVAQEKEALLYDEQLGGAHLLLLQNKLDVQRKNFTYRTVFLNATLF